MKPLRSATGGSGQRDFSEPKYRRFMYWSVHGNSAGSLLALLLGDVCD